MVAIGQQEVYDFLTRNKGTWFTSRDISEQLHVSIGSVTMSLKKLRKTSLIKYKNTGVRNTFIYTVEPEGVTVPPPPGVLDTEEPEQEQRAPIQKQERILPKIVTPKKSIPLVVPRPVEPEPVLLMSAKPKAAKKSKPKKAKLKLSKPKKMKKPATKAAKRAKPARKSPKRASKPKRIASKRPARRKPAPKRPKSLFHQLKRMIRR